MKNFNRLIKQIIFVSVFLFATQLSAQNIAITDDNGYTANSSAMLDVKSTTKGMLVPRLTTTQRENVSNPAIGLLVFDTTLQCFFYYNGTAWVNLLATSDYAGGTDASLFTVLNLEGDTVFAVYPGGVRINVDNSPEKVSGSKGGFAVGGFSSKLTSGQDYLRVTNDSVRVYVDDNPAKISGSKGGFAVGGFSSKKTSSGNFLHLTPENYFIGHEAGKSITSGLFNSFFGYQTGYSNTSGHNNVFIGYSTGHSNTDGHLNSFFGYKAGYSNTIGQSNVFIGNMAGLSNTTGNDNVFLGDMSGKSNLIGSSNVFLGRYTGSENTDGNRNSFVGPGSGMSNTIGSYNSFFGHDAGYHNKTGENNVYIGSGAGYSDSLGSNNVFIGYWAGASETGSGKLYIDNCDSDSSQTLIFGDFSSNYIRINNRLGIGRHPVMYNLELEGNASKTTAGNWLANSDKRIKTDILDIENSFKTILKLHPVIFKYTDEWRKQHTSIEDRYYYNFIAQEYQNVFPDAVKGSGEYLEGDNKEILQIQTYDAQIVTIKAVQNLIIENQNLNTQIKSQNKRIKTLENDITEIKKILEKNN